MPTNREYDSDNEIPQESEQYAFIEEKIKSDTFDIKKTMNKLSWIACIGLVFGAFACISFFALKPWAESVFQKEPDKIEIPADAPVVEEDEPVQEQESTLPELTIENLEQLNYELNKVASQAQKSMVNVIGVIVNDQEEEEKLSVAGVLVADNGQELLMLADVSDIGNAKLYKVKFFDDAEYDVNLKQMSENSHIGIFSIKKNIISDATWSKIAVAQFGSSNAFARGKTMIALGNLYGYENEMGYGIASSVDLHIARTDGEYSMLVTDIPGSAGNSGVLFDIHGNIVGIINNEIAQKSQGSVIVAYGISSLKNEIELMSNGKPIPYIGIIGTVVNDIIAKEQNIPEGLYVTEVEPESPAMAAGIQSGDIITDIGIRTIESLAGYQSELMTKEVGEEIRLKGMRYGADSYVEINFNVTVGKNDRKRK